MQLNRSVTIAALLVSAATTDVQAQLRSRVVASGFTVPVAFVQDPANRAVRFVVEQGGRVRKVRDGLPARCRHERTRVRELHRPRRPHATTAGATAKGRTPT